MLSNTSISHAWTTLNVAYHRRLVLPARTRSIILSYTPCKSCLVFFPRRKMSGTRRPPTSRRPVAHLHCMDNNHHNAPVEANSSSDQDEEESGTSGGGDQRQGSHSRLSPLSFAPAHGHESSGSTSLSDIIEGLPLAVKSSLGPLRTIRRSVSIRGWASYFYEISTSSRTVHTGNTTSREQRTAARQCHSHTLAVSTSTTTSVEMQQQQDNRGGGPRRRTGPSSSTTVQSDSKWAEQKATTSTEVYEYREQNAQKSAIDRFCGSQGERDTWPYPFPRRIHLYNPSLCHDVEQFGR